MKKIPTETPRTDNIAHASLEPHAHISRLTDLARDMERSLAFSQRIGIQTQAELLSAKQAISDLEDVLNKFKLGYQGCCYACEPVGILNQRLEAELEEMKKVTMEIVDSIKGTPEWQSAVDRFLELAHIKK